MLQKDIKNGRWYRPVRNKRAASATSALSLFRAGRTFGNARIRCERN